MMKRSVKVESNSKKSSKTSVARRAILCGKKVLLINSPSDKKKSKFTVRLLPLVNDQAEHVGFKLNFQAKLT